MREEKSLNLKLEEKANLKMAIIKRRKPPIDVQVFRQMLFFNEV
jgi:hypothetical protein